MGVGKKSVAVGLQGGRFAPGRVHRPRVRVPRGTRSRLGISACAGAETPGDCASGRSTLGLPQSPSRADAIAGMATSPGFQASTLRPQIFEWTRADRISNHGVAFDEQPPHGACRGRSRRGVTFRRSPRSREDSPCRLQQLERTHGRCWGPPPPNGRADRWGCS